MVPTINKVLFAHHLLTLSTVWMIFFISSLALLLVSNLKLLEVIVSL